MYDSKGIAHRVKALLDSGSMSSFVTQELCNKLQLPRTATNVQVRGITNSPENIHHSCQVMIHAVSTNFTLKTNCLIISKIASTLPSHPVNSDNWNLPTNLTFADPNFGVPADIHILIGANYFWDVLLSGQQSLGKNMPVLQNTRFGHVVSGPMPFVKANIHSFHCVSSNIDNSLTKFWEVEKIANKRPWSQEENECEHHFQTNTSRDEAGRFVVRIPFKINPASLGDSQEHAKRRFFNLERKCISNPNFREHYMQFMQEYENLGHMTSVTDAINRRQWILFTPPWS